MTLSNHTSQPDPGFGLILPEPLRCLLVEQITQIDEALDGIGPEGQLILEAEDHRIRSLVKFQIKVIPDEMGRE